MEINLPDAFPTVFDLTDKNNRNSLIRTQDGKKAAIEYETVLLEGFIPSKWLSLVPK